MIEEECPRVCNPGNNRSVANKSCLTPVIILSPMARRLIDGVEQGHITSYNFSGWFRKYWLLSEPEKNSIWYALSKTIDHDVFREFKALVVEREQLAMPDMIARKSRRWRLRG